MIHAAILRTLAQAAVKLEHNVPEVPTLKFDGEEGHLWLAGERSVRISGATQDGQAMLQISCQGHETRLFTLYDSFDAAAYAYTLYLSWLLPTPVQN